MNKEQSDLVMDEGMRLADKMMRGVCTENGDMGHQINLMAMMVALAKLVEFHVITIAERRAI